MTETLQPSLTMLRLKEFHGLFYEKKNCYCRCVGPVYCHESDNESVLQLALYSPLAI